MQFYVRRGREEDADKARQGRGRGRGRDEECRELSSNPPHGLVGNALTSLSIFHTLMTRKRKAAKGAKGDRSEGPARGR